MPNDEAQTWVFDETQVHTYELSLDPAVWEALQASARDEEYAEAELSAAGQVLGRVGLRFKGSLGTLVSCVADDGTFNCDKLSMKVKFDEYLPEQRFFGLKRLNFHGLMWDDSQLRERVAYRVFREMGVVAPRAVHARLIINGEDWGLFAAIEEVDGRFTDDHFEPGDGNLYKEAWPGTADEETLAAALDTNEEVGDHAVFRQFQEALLAAEPGELPGVLDRFVDIDNTFAYLAVDRAIVNWDGIAAFYCYEGYCENHNYYWYQDEVEPRFALVPWDLDQTFVTSSPLASVPDLFDTDQDCSVLHEAMGRTLLAPSCDPILRGLAEADRARYTAQVQRLLEGPFAPGAIEGWVAAWREQIAPEVATDGRGPGSEQFEAAADRLLGTVETLRERVASELGGL